MNETVKPTIWQHARTKFQCHCQCALATTIPIIRGDRVTYMALCPECNERHYIRVGMDEVNLESTYIKAEE